MKIAPMPNIPAWALAAGAVGIAGVALWAWARGLKGMTADIVGGAVGAVDSVASGVVVGIGNSVGIPETDEALCNAAKASGDLWETSFYCPAGTFLKEVFTGKPAKTKSAPIAAPVYDPSKQTTSWLDLSGGSFEEQANCALPGVICNKSWYTDPAAQPGTASIQKQPLTTPVAGIRG